MASAFDWEQANILEYNVLVEGDVEFRFSLMFPHKAVISLDGHVVHPRVPLRNVTLVSQEPFLFMNGDDI
jgi:hypothetical protein